MSNNDEEFWKGVAYITGDLIITETYLKKSVRWHIRWTAINKINYHHSPDINVCHRVLFNPIDKYCGQGIVEECNCPAGVKD